MNTKLLLSVISIIGIVFISMPANAEEINAITNGYFDSDLSGWSTSGDVVWGEPGVARLLWTSNSTITQNFLSKSTTLEYDISSNTGIITTVKIVNLDTSDVLFNNPETNGHYIKTIPSNTNIHINFNRNDPSPVTDVWLDNIENNYTQTYDPSGYVKLASGTPVFNAKVQLSNATWTDPCTAGSGCFTNAAGYWDTNIYANGDYFYNVSKEGYTTLTGTQAFTIGGVNNNFTLSPASGQITGHVYTTINGSGTVPIQGNLDILKKDVEGATVAATSTLTLSGAPDGNGYILRVDDVDSANQQAVIDILKNGGAFVDNLIVDVNELQQIKISESAFSTDYIEFTVTNIFQGGEINSADINAGFASYAKTGTSLFAFINGLLSGPGSLSWNLVLQNLVAWAYMTTDGSNESPVTFNSSLSREVIGSQVFDVTDSGNIQSFYIVLNAESTTQSNGKASIGYTDDDIQAPPSFSDALYINQRMRYQTSRENFTALDANANKKVRVWFKLHSGYSNFNIYEFFMVGIGSSSKVPLIDANVYYNNTVFTLSKNPDGFYSLKLPLSSYTVKYYKAGYETKTLTYEANATNPSFSYDVILNSTDTNETLFQEYIYADPDPSTIGTTIKAYYKTLDKTSLIGGYEISVCPLLDVGEDCDKYDVNQHTESFINLRPVGIGEYVLSLTGYKDGLLDIDRDVIAADNFSVTGNTPIVNWSQPKYYLGQLMRLKIFVPTGSQVVTVLYPNGSVAYNNSFSAAGTIYNVSFGTNANTSLNTYPPGLYRASVTGGNTEFTELVNESVFAYSVTAPASVSWGTKFNIEYVSPQDSTLYVTNSSNYVFLSRSVQGKGIYEANTRSLPNKNDVLTIKLIRAGYTQANTTVNIIPGSGTDGTIPSGADANNQMANNLNTFMSTAAFWGVLIFAFVMIAGASYHVQGAHLGMVGFILANIEAVAGLWAPYTWYVLIVLWLGAGIFYTVGSKASGTD